MTRERAFHGVATSSHAARRWMSQGLREAGIAEEAVFRAEQVLAELISNGVRHTRSGEPGGWIHVRLRLGASRLRLEVTDQGSEHSEPRACRAGPDASRGHGLYLVEALAQRWWTRSGGWGRTMFVEIAYGDAAAASGAASDGTTSE